MVSFFVSDVVVQGKEAGQDGNDAQCYDDNGKEVTVNQGRTMVFIIRDDTDWFEINGTYYDPDDHHTITEEESGEGDTGHEVSEVEEPVEEEM